MAYQKGQSGNPKGRPPKARALTALLEATGNKTIEVNGKNLARKRVLANLLWEAATTGNVTLPDGQKLDVSLKDMLEIAKWIFSHIDGPPKQDVEVTGPNGGPIPIREVVLDLSPEEAEDE